MFLPDFAQMGTIDPGGKDEVYDSAREADAISHEKIVQQFIPAFTKEC